MISKKTKLNSWSKTNRIIAFIVVITAFVWTLMLYEICKGVYYNVFA